jgi:REP-associated tyrosine transposase
MPLKAETGQPAKQKTCKRVNKPGHAHSLTFCCFRRKQFLSRERTRDWMINAIAFTCKKHELDLWAFVIMPEHVHLLIHPRRDRYDISKVLSSLKQPVSKKAILYIKQTAPSQLHIMTDVQPNGRTSLRFWQRGGGYDRNLWSPRYIWETIDYIHANLVRRGLCKLDIDWHWSSARAHTGVDEGLLKIDASSLPNDPRRINAV